VTGYGTFTPKTMTSVLRVDLDPGTTASLKAWRRAQRLERIKVAGHGCAGLEGAQPPDGGGAPQAGARLAGLRACVRRPLWRAHRPWPRDRPPESRTQKCGPSGGPAGA